MSKTLSVRCPDCDCALSIDAETGAIVHHQTAKKPIAGGKTFDDLFHDLDEQKERASKVFDQEKAALEDRDRLLDERFEQAMKRAQENPDEAPPKRPFELD